VKKKLIKSIKILKKPTGSIQFWFYKPEPEKTEPNPNQKNRAKPVEPVFVLKNRTEPNQTNTGWFEPVSVLF